MPLTSATPRRLETAKILGREFAVGAMLFAALSVAACGSSKQSECVTLIAVINTGLDTLESNRQQTKNDPTKSVEARSMAASMEKVAEDIKALELKTPELKDIAKRYEAMARDVAKFAREGAEASEQKDVAAVNKAHASLNESLKLEDPIINDLNAACAK
ncbi:MAG: hypothetical protein U0271_33635 [Polyangiaceae bacterium]